MITDDFWAYVVDAVEHLEQRSYYRLLGVPADADADTIGHAFYALVRRLHPDRHISESAGRQRMLTRVYARMNEAHRVLSKADSRAAYDRALARGQMRLTRADQSAEAKRRQGLDPRTPQARAMYDKGRALLGKGEFRAARAQWQLAVQFEPDSQALRTALSDLDIAERDAQADVGEAPEPDQSGRDSLGRESTIQATPKPVAPAREPSTSTNAAAEADEPLGPADHGLLGREALAEDRLEEACTHLEHALLAQPRNRQLRAVWYAALARRARAAGNLRAAKLHRQTALAFDSKCEAAQQW